MDMGTIQQYLGGPKTFLEHATASQEDVQKCLVVQRRTLFECKFSTEFVDFFKKVKLLDRMWMDKVEGGSMIRGLKDT